MEGRVRDLALFNLAIDSKLGCCDVVALPVEVVAPNGYERPRTHESVPALACFAPPARMAA